MWNFFLHWWIYSWRKRNRSLREITASTENFFRRGNLITTKHVLTAAHCLHNKGQTKQLEAKEVAVLLGRHDLNSINERGSERREVKEIVMHHDWRNDTDKFDGNVVG